MLINMQTAEIQQDAIYITLKRNLQTKQQVLEYIYDKKNDKEKYSESRGNDGAYLEISNILFLRLGARHTNIYFMATVIPNIYALYMYI